MKSRTKWTVLLFGLLVVGGLVLAACQTGPAPTAERIVETVVVTQEVIREGETVVVTEVVEVVVTPEVSAGPVGQCCDAYRIGIFEDPLTINYWSYLGPDNSVWTSYVLGGNAASLYTLSDQRFDFVPVLAKDLPPDPVQEGDFWTITVEMVDNATWSDGEPITAHDVEFTVQTVLDLQLTGNWPAIYRPDILDHVEAVDDYTVKFFFNDIPGLAQWQFAAAQGPILPEHFWGDTVANARTFVEGVTAPEAERPADCDAEGLSDEEAAACDAWATYDEAFENARKTLYEAEVAEYPVYGGYLVDRLEPGAFVQKTANTDNYYRQGAEIIEYSDGTYVETFKDGRTIQLYGDATGDETLRYVNGPYSPNVIMSIYGSQDSAFLAMANGEVDYVLNPLSLARGLREQAERGEGITTVVNPDNGLFYLAFNIRKDPYSFPEFREAVDIIIDKDFVADTILQGTVIPTWSVVPAGNAFWFNPDVPTPFRELTREERVNMAVQVLKDAGWSWDTEPAWNPDRDDVDPGVGIRMPNGQPMPDTTILGPGPAYDPQRATFNQWISEWMRELGMPVESELTGFNTILNPVFVEANFDMYILGWGLTIYPDYIYDFFHSSNDTAVSGNYNTPGLNDPEFDALAEAFLAETDIIAAQEKARELQVMLSELRPYIPLFNRTSIDLYRSNIQFPYTETLGGLSDAGEAAGMQVEAQVFTSR